MSEWNEAIKKINDKYGKDFWFKFRDAIHDVGKPEFSIVSNEENEHPDKDIIRISDCKFSVFIDITSRAGRQDSLDRAASLCRLLNSDYLFFETVENIMKEIDE